MAETRPIKVRVKRYDPSDGGRARFQSYEVPLEEGMSVLNVLNYIYENLDHSLAHYYSCRTGKCTGCHALVNGKVRLTCTTKAEGDLKLEPMPGYRVIRDLVVDRSTGEREHEEG
ncbi:MAG: 2Fe-2S iron-sulfur cluster-binding protein [Nitrospinota bacterium]